MILKKIYISLVCDDSTFHILFHFNNVITSPSLTLAAHKEDSVPLQGEESSCMTSIAGIRSVQVSTTRDFALSALPARNVIGPHQFYWPLLSFIQQRQAQLSQLFIRLCLAKQFYNPRLYQISNTTLQANDKLSNLIIKEIRES